MPEKCVRKGRLYLREGSQMCRRGKLRVREERDASIWKQCEETQSLAHERKEVIWNEVNSTFYKKILS